MIQCNLNALAGGVRGNFYFKWKQMRLCLTTGRFLYSGHTTIGRPFDFKRTSFPLLFCYSTYTYSNTLLQLPIPKSPGFATETGHCHWQKQTKRQTICLEQRRNYSYPVDFGCFAESFRVVRGRSRSPSTAQFCHKYYSVSGLRCRCSDSSTWERHREESESVTSMDLQQVVGVLKTMAAPSLAGSWDNVGLLIEPSPPHSVSKLLLTNDLSPAVMQEAINKGVNLIVSYHPPIFTPLKRITQGSWKERIAGQCLESRIALYSPHTSWDAVAGGVNDWLIGAFDAINIKPVDQTEQMPSCANKTLVFRTRAKLASLLTQEILPSISSSITSYKVSLVDSGGDSDYETQVHIKCPASCVLAILQVLLDKGISAESLECRELSKVPTLGYGMGRVGQLRSPVSVDTAVAAVKLHLGLTHVRLAQAAGTAEIRSVAVCAGSGGSVLRGVKADLYLTGEMSHHEVLDATCQGTHVILCDHSNTERGFLKVVQQRLNNKLEQKVEVFVSETDRDPLLVV